MGNRVQEAITALAEMKPYWTLLAETDAAEFLVQVGAELAAAREENQQLRKMWKDEYMQGQKSVGGEPTDEEAETALDAALKGGAKWK